MFSSDNASSVLCLRTALQYQIHLLRIINDDGNKRSVGVGSATTDESTKRTMSVTSFGDPCYWCAEDVQACLWNVFDRNGRVILLNLMMDFQCVRNENIRQICDSLLDVLLKFLSVSTDNNACLLVLQLNLTIQQCHLATSTKASLVLRNQTVSISLLFSAFAVTRL